MLHRLLEPKVFRIGKAADELLGRGISPRAPPCEVWTGWAFEIADPWCNVLGFTVYVKEPERARA